MLACFPAAFTGKMAEKELHVRFDYEGNLIPGSNALANCPVVRYWV